MTFMTSKGCAFEFLSRISLNNEKITAHDSVPFSEDLTVQHGTQILCLPFNISPLALPNKLQSLPKRVTVSDNLRFDPAIGFNFLAAYPILMPLYLAQYETADIKTTVVKEAFSSSGRTYFELFEHLPLLSRFANHVHGDYWQVGGAATPFSNVSMPSRRHAGELQQWLDRIISQPGGPENLVSHTPFDFTDQRVRELTEDETEKNRDFLDVSNKMAQMKFMLKNFTDEDSDASKTPTLTIKIGLGGISKVEEDQFLSSIKSEIKILQNKRDALMPQWWKDMGAKKT